MSADRLVLHSGDRYLSSMTQAIDTLIHARWVVTVDGNCDPCDDHSVAVHDHRIVEVLPRAEAVVKYRCAQESHLDSHILIPGLVNTHTHAAMTLFRGLADDLPLMDWLHHHIWPAETRWVDEEFVRVGSSLAAAEMLRSGTTCFNDMYFFPDVVAEVARNIGIRASIGLIQIDFPTAWAQTPEDYFRRGLELHDEVKNWDLITTAFAPHAPYSVSDKPLIKIQTLADELDMPIHMHVHETEHEIRTSIEHFRMRPLERLSRLGLLTDRLLAVHMTQLLPAEIEAVADSGAHVIHCPESNLKLASGLCPVAKMADTGINVAIGTDGAASNNDLDMLSEMRTAALLAKGVSQDPTVLPAHEALRMATVNGARALGLEDITGTITPGKCADLVAVDLDHINTRPTYDPVNQLVYSAGRNQVSDVWVNGNHVVSAGKLTTIDVAPLFAQVSIWADRIIATDSESNEKAAS